jgi:ribosomal protein L37E
MFFAVRIIEHTEGHYEIQVLDFGTTYRWRPENVEIECEECGRRSIHTRSSLISSLITCECDKDDTARMRADLVVQVLKEEDEVLHPWRD